MAVNEEIVLGRFFRKMIDVDNKKWQRISLWHKACDSEYNDGKNGETKLGAIKGITSDTNVTTTGYAADMMAVKEINNSLNGCSFEQEGEDFYITGADSVRKKLGNTTITFDISGSGDNPNYLSSAVFQFHRTSFDGFLNAGYTKCKIVFSSFSGAQLTGRLEIRKNGVISKYYSNPGTIEFNLAKGDYIAGYVQEQRTFRFGASVTMSL